MLARVLAKRGVPAITGETVASLLVAFAVAFVVHEVNEAGEFDRGVLSALPAFLSLLTLSLGVWLVGEGAPHRVGAARHCAHCGYVMLEPADRLVPLCPECSNPWRYFGRAARGERVRRPLLLSAGIGAIVLAALGAVYHAELRQSVYDSLPTSTLIRHISTSSPAQASDAWDTLSTRTLSAYDTDQLALAILDKRAKWRGLDIAAEQWLDDQLARNKLSPAAKERYFGELVQLHLHGAERAVARERLEYSISADLHRSLPQTPVGEVYVLLAGYEIIPIDPPPGPKTPGMPGRTKMDPPPPPGRVDYAMTPDALSRATRPRGVLFPLEPGRVRVRATAYVVIAGARPTVTWQPDGTPSLDVPAAALIPVVLVREVHVAKPEG